MENVGLSLSHQNSRWQKCGGRFRDEIQRKADGHFASEG